MHDDFTRKFQSLLRELFQFEVADLDTGLYRILNLRRDQIRRFIDVTLPAKIDEQFPTGEAGDGSDRAEVYSHLIEFFSRYYDSGDFMSQRRQSSRQKYSIPYQGEEVLLHWANKDQYYVKTSRKLKRLAVRDPAERFTLEFTVVESKELQNNVVGETTYFQIYRGNDPITWNPETGIMQVRFELHGIAPSEEKELGGKGGKAQESLLVEAEKLILERSNREDQNVHVWLTSPKQEWYGKEESRPTVLKAALNRYVREGKEDFFIHKRLGAFLTEELDFYLKNEVFLLDGLGTAEEADLAPALARARAIKAVASEIIAFLDQLESFQKMLFEKKKFIVQCEYCTSLDRVPPDLYPEIAANEEQMIEWRKILSLGDGEQKTIFGDRIDVAFLETHPFLMIDTRFFNETFKDRLLASFDNIDDMVGGLAVKSENWQALNLLEERYNEQVKCVYLDPPYNTGYDGFLYKDRYQHSSWLSMMKARLEIAWKLSAQDGIFFINIDDHEQPLLLLLIQEVFGESNFLSTVVWEKVYSPRMDAVTFSSDHDYIHIFSKSSIYNICQIPFEQKSSQFSSIDSSSNSYYRRRSLRKEGSGSLRSDRPNLFYGIEAPDGEIIFPIRPDGREGRWRWEHSTYEKKKDQIDWVKSHGIWQPYVKQYIEQSACRPPSSLWHHTEAGHNHEAAEEIKALFKNNVFLTPKPTRLVRYILSIVDSVDGVVADFFAGSGTTAHAVLLKNREDNGRRKYVVVEMGDYFDTVLLPRIEKVCYSKDWSEGRAQSIDGQSHILKYITLEQYEDTLNNIQLAERGTVQQTLFSMHDYLLSYFLDAESKESPCRLSDTLLAHPFDYTLRVAKETLVHAEDRDTGTDDDLPCRVDLVETFNYLLGLHVIKRLTYQENGTRYVAVLGRQNYDYIVAIWRTAEDIDLAEDRTFIEGTILPELRAAIGVPGAKEHRFFVNADCVVKDAEPIGPTFRRLMGA